MDLKKADQLQTLLEMTTEYINEMLLTTEVEHMTTVEMFEEAVSLALIQFQFATKTKPHRLKAGKVDTNSVAFGLHDKETIVVLQGNAEFAEMLDMDYFEVEDDNED